MPFVHLHVFLAKTAMAKLFVTLLLFFFVVAPSQARDLTERSENEVFVRDSVATDVQDSDSKASILLPSEKLSESEPRATTVEWKQVSTESKPSEFSETVAPETTKTNSRPLIMITFRPINRQFPRRSMPLIFRRQRHRCHQRNHQGGEFKPWGPSARAGEISYDFGNDMILSGEHSSFNSDVRWESDRKIPLRWTEFRRAEPWDSFRSDRKEDNKKLHHHHFHHRHEDVEEKEEREEKHKHKEKSGFLKSFRKFLNQFEF